MSLSRWKYGLAMSLGLVGAISAWANEKPVYRCPGKPVLYTDTLSAKEAQAKGCTALEGGPITVISSPKLGHKSTPTSVASSRSSSASPGGGETRIDPSEQRARDTDARRILELELRKEEDNLAQLKKEFNNGEPERRGEEKNYQKYLDRVNELAASLARKEGDVAALKRELAKLP